VPKLAVVEQIAKIIVIFTSAAAGFFWIWASLTKIPLFPDVGFDSDSSVFEPIRKALQTSSRRNAIAACFAGLAAVASVVVRLPSVTEMMSL